MPYLKLKMYGILINVNKLQNQIIYIDTGCELDTSAGTD